jgi:hypothetical protein
VMNYPRIMGSARCTGFFVSLCIVPMFFGTGDLPASDNRQPVAIAEKKMIPLSQLKEMFAKIRAETKWNIDGDMLWGYFFTDTDSKKLQPLVQHLTSRGYRIVSTEQREDGVYWLHVERVETHTPDSLHKLNQEFYRLASEYKLNSYDGMDVGPAPSTERTPRK